MMWLRFAVPVVLLLALLAEVGLDHWYRDKRTTKYKRLRLAFVVLAIGSCFATIGQGFLAAQEADAAALAENRAREEARMQVQAATQREEEALGRLREVQSQLADLQSAVRPVVDLARRLYPSASQSQSLSQLAIRLESLEGQAARLAAERAELQRLKETPPQVVADLLWNSKTSKFIVQIGVVNRIPIEASWSVVTRENGLVSPFMMSKAKLIPSPGRNGWRFDIDIQTEQIKEEFLELRVSWTSLYWAEMNRPAALIGKISKQYRFSFAGLDPL